MADPTAVNSQITDAVTQANTKILGDAPAMAMINLFQATAQTFANAAPTTSAGLGVVNQAATSNVPATEDGAEAADE
jgi:hypothetical protein